MTVAAAMATAMAMAIVPARAEEPRRSAHEATDVAASFPIRVEELRIVGLTRTRPRVVRRELGFAEGEVLTKEALDLAVARLWNTGIFARVDARVIREAGRAVVVVRLEDRWTLIPLFTFGSGGDAYYFRGGAAESNLAGRFLEVQAQYENFDGFHGGLALFRDPRLLDRRIELTVQADRLVRPRTGFSDQRTRALVDVSALFDHDRLRLGLRASAFADRFLEPLSGPVFYPTPSETVLVEPVIRIGRVDAIRVRHRGASLELRPAVAATTSDVADAYAGFTLEARGYLMLGARWNLAARARAAGVSHVPPHLMLYAGGLDLVRGFPDSYVRTNALALGNVEARFTAFDSRWVALVLAAFVDAIAARAPSGAPGTALSVGGGVRAIVPKLVGTGLRVDLAVPVHASLRAVEEPEQSRFGPVTPRAAVGSVQPSVGVFQFF